MGTHPIFESDFDCLTVFRIMSDNEVEIETCWKAISFLLTFILAAIGFQFFGPFQTPMIEKLLTAAAGIKKNVLEHIVKRSRIYRELIARTYREAQESKEAIVELEDEKKELKESQKETLTDLQYEEKKVSNLQETNSKLESQIDGMVNNVDRLEMTLEGEKKRTEQGEEDLKNERESRALLEKEHIDLSRKLELSENREKAAGNTQAQIKINRNFYFFREM